VSGKYQQLLQWAKNLLSGSIACGLIIVLLIKLFQHYDVLLEQKIALSPARFILSLLPLILSYFFIPFMWCIILKSLGIFMPYQKSFQIQYISHLGKYIPGKIWPYIAQSYLALHANIPVKTTLLSNAILMYFMSIGSLLVFVFSFLFWDIFPLATRCLSVLLSFFLVYLVFWINILEKSINLLFVRLTGISIIFCSNSLNYLRLFVVLFLDWIIFWTGFHIMVNSFYNIELIQSIIIVGIFSISWLVGYYAFFSPGGLGIQEGVQVYLLQFFFPLPISIVIAFSARLWMTIGDLCVSLLAAALLIYENRSQKSVHGALL
jgi:hypothetical protein